MKQIGSQIRETLEDSGCQFHRRINSEEVILIEDGQFQLWAKNDHHSGYVIEIDGIGYEFCSSIKSYREIEELIDSN